MCDKTLVPFFIRAIRSIRGSNPDFIPERPGYGPDCRACKPSVRAFFVISSFRVLVIAFISRYTRLVVAGGAALREVFQP